jgi:hypothetical protein
MATYVDINGQRQQIDLGGMAIIKEAQDKKLSVRQCINQKYPVAAGQPEAFKQMCIGAGLRFKKDENTGIPAANLLELFDPIQKDAAGSYTNQPAAPDSRILFMPAIMEIMENKLQSKEDTATSAFESLVGFRETIATSKFSTPVLNYSGAKGPESNQFQRIGQNSLPPVMLSFTSSDVDRKIPTTSIGMEISREALASNSLDIIALTFARFYKMADYSEWTTQLGLILSGDPDAAVTTFSAGTSALAQVKADTLDATLIAAGTISQKAWLAWLYANSMSMVKTHAVMDFATAYALDIRANRPTNVMNNSTDRLDTPFEVIYPTFGKTIKVIVMPAGTWTANTIMALDQPSPALAKVTSTFAQYSAIEDVVLRKSTVLRIDRGFIAYRMWDAAFNVLSLTTS